MDMILEPQLLPGWRKLPARAVDKWIVAVDLGQTTDPTAICVMNHRVVPGEKWISDHTRRTWKQNRTEHFDVRYLQRLPLGLAYPIQVQQIANILARPPLHAGCDFLVDETGVGRAVSDIFDATGLHPKRVTITAGLETTQHSGNSWHVPKGVLISGLDARLHTAELKIAAALSDAPALAEELKDFQRKVNEAGRASYNARIGAHDDLVLAVAIALWWATSQMRQFTQGPLPWEAGGN